MTINFILPFAGNKPIGGFKIVYEYANRLSGNGHKVNVIHPWIEIAKKGNEFIKQFTWENSVEKFQEVLTT